MPLPRADVLYGVAYKIVYERCDPDNCTTIERLYVVQEIASKIVEWASKQPIEISTAYLRAAPEVVKRAADVVENNLRAKQMIEARRILPEPPKD